MAAHQNKTENHIEFSFRNNVKCFKLNNKMRSKETKKASMFSFISDI